jgi:hypothetical protein
MASFKNEWSKADQMSSYTVTGMEKAEMSRDRSRFGIEFRTDQGPVTLTVQAEHLDALVTCLIDLEYKASILDPVGGPQPGEMGQIRTEIVESHQISNGVVNGVPSVFLGLKSAQVFRLFALDKGKAEVIQQSLADEIPKLKAGFASH